VILINVNTTQYVAQAPGRLLIIFI